MLAIIPFEADHVLFTHSIADISSAMINHTGQVTEVVKMAFNLTNPKFNNISHLVERAPAPCIKAESDVALCCMFCIQAFPTSLHFTRSLQLISKMFILAKTMKAQNKLLAKNLEQDLG